MKNIIWLASYPKSGNTWLRTFFSSLITGADLNLRNLTVNQVFNRRAPVQRHLELDPDLLTPKELDFYYPGIWEAEDSFLRQPTFIKTHEAFRVNDAGRAIHPPNATRCAIYVIRNPLDVCISLSHFVNISIDKAIDFMNDPAGSNKELFFANWQTLLPSCYDTWSHNVQSWQNQQELPVYFVRYEDLLANSLDEFLKLVEFTGLPYTPQQVEDAMERVKFDQLVKLEKQVGFDRPPVTDAFFRKGTKDQWKDRLSEKQINTVITANADVMKTFNYI